MAWYAEQAAGGHQGLVIDEESGRSVAVVYDPKDAPLLSAAPKLLEACKAVKERLDYDGNFGMAGDPLCKRALMAFLTDAVAEATA